jgi:hypothetical protein
MSSSEPSERRVLSSGEGVMPASAWNRLKVCSQCGSTRWRHETEEFEETSGRPSVTWFVCPTSGDDR